MFSVSEGGKILKDIRNHSGASDVCVFLLAP